MAWAANFDDFLNVPMTNNVNWTMRTSGMHSTFGTTDAGNIIAETASIADLYSGMPIIVCLFKFIQLFQCMIELKSKFYL